MENVAENDEIISDTAVLAMKRSKLFRRLECWRYNVVKTTTLPTNDKNTMTNNKPTYALTKDESIPWKSASEWNEIMTSLPWVSRVNFEFLKKKKKTFHDKCHIKWIFEISASWIAHPPQKFHNSGTQFVLCYSFSKRSKKSKFLDAPMSSPWANRLSLTWQVNDFF